MSDDSQLKFKLDVEASGFTVPMMHVESLLRAFASGAKIRGKPITVSLDFHAPDEVAKYLRTLNPTRWYRR